MERHESKEARVIPIILNFVDIKLIAQVRKCNQTCNK